MNIISIEATTLPDSWFQAVYKCIEHGREFKIDQGSYEGQKRLEFDYITIRIKNPGIYPLLPKIPPQYNLPDPVSEEYLADYVPYLMTEEIEKGEAYTYGNRLCSAHSEKWSNKTYDEFLKNPEIWFWNKGMTPNYTNEIHKIDIKNSFGINQIEYIIKQYKESIRSNQHVLQIAEPSDILLKDPPCLRSIDTRIQDGKLHFFPYFRSNDLWGGYPANLASIQILKEYMANEIGVKDGEIIYSSKGLHIYDYVWELAECIRGKTIQEFRNGK